MMTGVTVLALVAAVAVTVAAVTVPTAYCMHIVNKSLLSLTRALTRKLLLPFCRYDKRLREVKCFAQCWSARK